MVSRENNVKRQILMVLRCLLVVDEMLQGQCPALEPQHRGFAGSLMGLELSSRHLCC